MEFSVPGLSSVAFQDPAKAPWPACGFSKLGWVPSLWLFPRGNGFILTHLASSLCRVLLCKRRESRPAEWMAQQFLGVVAKVFPTAYSVPVETVARAMVASVLQPGKGNVEVLENAAIHELGKTVPQEGT